MIIKNSLDVKKLEIEHRLQCSYCGEDMDLPFIYWMLSDGDICLHASCVIEFFTKLDLEAKEIMGEI